MGDNEDDDDEEEINGLVARALEPAMRPFETWLLHPKSRVIKAAVLDFILCCSREK